MKLIIQATIENISTRNDNTIKVVLGTQEVDSSIAGSLFQMRNKLAKVLISDTNITDIESALVDEQKISASKKRSSSSRLRNVLYVYHEQQGLDMDFETFYTSEIEKIITHYKTKLT